MNKKTYTSAIILLYSITASLAISQTTVLPAQSLGLDSFLPTVNANIILTAATGFIQDSATAPARSSFDTNVGCPANFTAYITLTPTTLNNTGGTGLNSMQACVISSTLTTNNVHVLIYTQQSTFSYNDTTPSGYYSNSSSSMNGDSMPGSTGINPITTSSAGITGLSWVQYCYPGSMSAPAYNCP